MSRETSPNGPDQSALAIRTRSNSPEKSPQAILEDAVAWLHLMEREADQTRNPALLHCLAYVSAITVGIAHAAENGLPLSSLDQPFSQFYTGESLGDPSATDPDEFGDILRLQFTASHIAQGWLEQHQNSRAARAIAEDPNAPFRIHRRLVYDIVTEVRPHLPTAALSLKAYFDQRDQDIFNIPPLVPNILWHLSGMVHQEAIDPETARQIAQKEVDRAISEAEITEEEGVKLLEPWGISPSLIPTMDSDEARRLIRIFRGKAQLLLSPDEN